VGTYAETNIGVWRGLVELHGMLLKMLLSVLDRPHQHAYTYAYGVFEVFLIIVYLNGQRLMRFISALLSCTPIVISILTSMHDIFEIIKMIMMIYHLADDITALLFCICILFVFFFLF